MSESLNNISALLDTTTLAQDSQALANSVSQLNADITQLSTQMKTLKVLVAKYYAGQSESVEVPELGVLDAVVSQL